MHTPQSEIVPGATVTLHFALSLTDGTEAISTFDEEPLTCQIGDNTFLPTMEMALYGLRVGDEQSLTLTPQQAYGAPDPDLIRQMPLQEFKEMPPELHQVMSFMLPNSEQTLGMVKAIRGNQVTVDFNHPMAGQEVVFRVKILQVA